MTCSRPARRPSSLGFTLLETILAVGLSALLIALVGAGIRIYTKTVAQRRADVVNAQLARVILNMIAQDLQRAFYVSEDDGGGAPADTGGESEGDTGDTGGDTTDETLVDATADLTTNAVQPVPGLYGSQTELQIDVLGRFADPIKYDSATAVGIDPQAANLLSDPKVITYFLRPIDASELAGTALQSLGASADTLQTAFVRRVNSRAEAVYSSLYGGGGEQAGEQLLSFQVASVQFTYHDGFDWVDSWDSSLAGGLPLAVNVMLAIVDETTTDSTDLSTLTTDNIFQLTVYLPTAEAPATDSTMTGI